MVRALALLYEATGGGAWRNNSRWLSGEPCVDGWFGVHCCPQSLPVLRGGDECTADGGGATGVRTTQGSPACHSGSVTGTALDLATCVVVKVLLPSNNLIGSLDGAVCELPFLQHLDLSGNSLIGALPSTAACLPQLTSLDLTVRRGWEDPGGLSGRVPEWLLDRLESLAPLRLANNAFDDPKAAESAAAISRIWQRCSTLGAEQCSGVPPVGCSAFNRQGQRYEVELNGLGCARCPTPIEIVGIASAFAGIALLFLMLVYAYTRFVRKYPEHAKTHVATIMILVGHLQTLTIIGSLQLGWPLIIQEILASINLPFMSYIPLPCILTDPVLKSLLSYAETAVVLLLLVCAWLVAWRRRKAATRAEDKREEAQKALEVGSVAADDAAKDASKAKAAAVKAEAATAEAEYFLCVLFSLLFTVGLRVSASLFMRYDENQTRLVIARLVASLLPLFWLFLLWRFRRLLRKARGAAREAERHAANPDAQIRVRLRRLARRTDEAVRYLTERYASDDGLSHGDFLVWAEKEIDGPIRERLADGTIRLLRCAWLLSADSDQYLGRDGSGKVIMRRRQELPEEAFLSPSEAVQLLDGADRSILALSYRWLTREHPDPHGTALCAVRRFLRSKDGLGKCGMFWDFTSLPQKDIAKEAQGLAPRTPEEADTMKRGLEGMGYLYASTCGTAVVQLKDIPPRPSEYDGRMLVFDEKYSEMTSKKDVIADLERFGGKITEIDIRPTVISATHKQEGEAHVTFATHKQAESCIAALREVGRGACTVYNETAYSRDRGEPFSGWCTFEEGVSKLAAAHWNVASRQATERSEVLPERLVRANASRAKVIDISDEKESPVDVKESPETLLKQTNRDLEIAQFVGKGESVQVTQLLEKLERSMNSAMAQATEDHARKSDDGLGPKAATEGGVPTGTMATAIFAQLPLRSQWQLVVWARQGLLFLLSFAMDCVVLFSPYEEHQTARYVFAGLAIAVLGGFWRLQAWRQPYAMRRQHWLEAFLYTVDILVIVVACLYGALTHDAAAQDGTMRLAFELGLGALLGASVLVAMLVVGRGIARERRFIQQYYLQHGLVQASEGTKEAAQIIDEPIVKALRDGAVRLIDCAWLLDSARSDKQLPRVTKVVARLASNEPRSALIRQLATHCGTSSICITVEAASRASAASPVRWGWGWGWGWGSAASPVRLRPRLRWRWGTPASEAAALEEIQLKDRSSNGHMSKLDVTFHLSTFDEAAPLTAAGLRRKAEAVEARLAQLPGLERVKIVTGKPFLPRCQDMPQDAFLSPERAAALFTERRRGVRVGSYCWRMPGMPDPDGRSLEKMRGYLNVKRGRCGEYGLFVDVACLPQTFSWPSWHAPNAIALRFGTDVDQGLRTVLKFECERVATEDEAQVCVDKIVFLCKEQDWALASIADFEGLGLRSRNYGSVLFHGRYISGVYHFDSGADAEGYVRFRTVGDADMARQHPKLKRMCGGKEPKLMGEHVFENELKFRRGLSVMGCLYASATGTCVLQLTDPPGALGEEVAPDELVSERTGTVFVLELQKLQKELGGKSLEEMQKVLQKELGDGVLACEMKGSQVVVRVLGERAARAVRLLKEGVYPLRRKDRVVYPMYNLRPYRSRGWPTFETSAASIVLAHLTQLKRRKKALPPLIAQAEESGPKFINIDVIGAPCEVVVAQSPEDLLRRCKKKLLSKKIFFTGKADRKVVVQLLSDFEDSIAVEFDQQRASHLNLRTEDLERARTKELGDARRSRDRKLQQRLTVHVEPTLIHHVSEPTHTIHVVPEAAVATKYPEPEPTVSTAVPLPQPRASPSLQVPAAPTPKPLSSSTRVDWKQAPRRLMRADDSDDLSARSPLPSLQVPAAPTPKPLSSSTRADWKQAPRRLMRADDSDDLSACSPLPSLQVPAAPTPKPSSSSTRADWKQAPRRLMRADDSDDFGAPPVGNFRRTFTEQKLGLELKADPQGRIVVLGGESAASKSIPTGAFLEKVDGVSTAKKSILELMTMLTELKRPITLDFLPAEPGAAGGGDGGSSRAASLREAMEGGPVGADERRPGKRPALAYVPKTALGMPVPGQRFAIGMSVFVRRSNGEEILAYVKEYDAEEALYTVEIERVGKRKARTCRDNDLRAATMQEVFSDPERERDALITFHADDSRLDA